MKKDGSMFKTPFIVWKDEFSVGMEKLDAQHKKVFVAINELYDAIQEKDQLHIIGKTLQILLEYTKTHFVDEEYIMKECNYPDYDLQQKAHEELTNKTKDLIEQSRRMSGDLSSDLLHFLKNWWTNHILTMDRKYAPFLRKQT